MSKSKSARMTFADRMIAVRHTLEAQNLSITSLTAAFEAANKVFDELTADVKRSDDALKLVSDAAREFLLARSITGCTGIDGTKPGALRLAEAIHGLANVIGYNIAQPYGRPEQGSLWSALKGGNDYRVNCIAAMGDDEYVVAEIRGTGMSTLVLLRDWHLTVQPAPQEDAEVDA